ncbi:hypothetical protein C0Q70_14465 [Xyrichtys novacula]|uniref:Uncharacterized protein n=1 Tax=Xyrichtys novacula TaxID=13765 RepID=A0AAV1F408_XYRNO|nr:hypothetical protein C0Q70_14465 [Xyrichtys novacula]
MRASTTAFTTQQQELVGLDVPGQLVPDPEPVWSHVQEPSRRDSSVEEPMTCAGQNQMEASSPKNPLKMKAKTRIGTWNIRTLYESSKSAQVASEMKRYNIALLGLSESRWNGSGQTRLTSGETIICPGHEDLGHDHTQGVALMMTPEATKALMA